MKNFIKKLMLSFLTFLTMYSCSTEITRTPAEAEQLKSAKSALYEKYKKGTDNLALSVDWVQGPKTDLLIQDLGQIGQEQIVLLYTNPASTSARKQAYFSYNRLIKLYIERSSSMEQIETLDTFLKSIETELKTGQVEGIGPDRLLYDLTPKNENKKITFYADENFTDPGASPRATSKSHESDRLAHLMNSYLNLITESEAGASRFQQVFGNMKGLSAVREFINFSGNSSVNSSSWFWSNFNLNGMVEAIHKMAKDEAAFNYLADLLKTIPLSKV
ncbi:MAG: hypothetical protein K2Q18_04825, partial [Bdellovibrionales bacterium]|nr:hypothetical protein [Bdellovibrionales bacterium]